MTLSLSYADLGIDPAFWADVQITSAAGEDENVLEFRAKFARRSDALTRELKTLSEQALTGPIEQLRQEWEAEIDRLADDESLTELERETKTREAGYRFSEKIETLKNDFQTAELEKILLDWDLKKTNGEPVPIADGLPELVKLFPSARAQLLAQWRDLTSERALVKN